MHLIIKINKFYRSFQKIHFSFRTGNIIPGKIIFIVNYY